MNDTKDRLTAGSDGDPVIPPPLPPPLPPPVPVPVARNAQAASRAVANPPARSPRPSRPSLPPVPRIRIAAGVLVGLAGGVVAGIALVSAVSYFTRGLNAKNAADAAMVTLVLGWAIIIVLAAQAAFGGKAVAASAGPVLFGLFLLARTAGEQLRKLGGPQHTSASPMAFDPPGAGTILAATLVGAMAGALLVVRRSRSAPDGPQT